MSDPGVPVPATTRVRSDFASFSVPQYAALGLVALAVVILGLWFVNWSTATTWEVVASGLTPEQAGEVADQLGSAGIDHRLANGGSAVEVPSGTGDEARVALGDLATTAGGVEGYELLDEQGFMISSFRQRIDYQRAVEGELTRTILSMDDVTSAAVHLAIPEERLFADDQELTRASVVIGGQVTQSTVASIANVVASSVPGLDAANVTVADTSGRILSGGNDTGFSRDQQLQMQEVYEAQLELAAESMLSVALGPGRAVVRVTADLDFDELESEVVTYATEEQVTLREQRLDEAFTGDNSVPLGTLGTAEDVTDAGELAGESGSAYLRQEVNSEFGVPTTRTVSRQAPGEVQRISVAVIVDDTLDPAPDPVQLEPLIAAAVGIDPDRGDSIVVQSMAFDELPDPAEAGDIAAAPPPGGGLEPILGHARTGAAVVGMILALLFLRKGLKTLLPAQVREPVEIDPATMAELTSAATPDDATDGAHDATALVPAIAGAAAPVPAAGAPSSTTIDMLDLIDSQSDEVAHLLRDLVAETAS